MRSGSPPIPCFWQIGAFPFDHIDNPDPNSAAAHDEVYKQQVGESWSEVPHIAKAVEKVRLAALGF